MISLYPLDLYLPTSFALSSVLAQSSQNKLYRYLQKSRDRDQSVSRSCELLKELPADIPSGVNNKLLYELPLSPIHDSPRLYLQPFT